ncbi:hypothetical protein [Hymenobacter ruricola]|uniref:DUF4190 domain-containing protein n=1 Tax=Hymenobacter ruricola TaxID=2791023 RepID=A0ABS0IA28_9BACT|nr:hypothetical protein [Hymenobacter ruricola]MBF9223808.1 hypothetical protein [Hymenobacter ruricola]
MNTPRCGWVLVTVAWALCSSGCRSTHASFPFHNTAQQRVSQAPREAAVTVSETAAQDQTVAAPRGIAAGSHRPRQRPQSAACDAKPRTSRVHSQALAATRVSVRSLPADSTKRRFRRVLRSEQPLPRPATEIGLLVFGALELLAGLLLRHSAVTGARAGAAIGESLGKAYGAAILIVLGAITLLAALIIFVVNDSKKRKHSPS